jgi:hypothetical protein
MEFVEGKFRAKWKELSEQTKGERQQIRQQLGVAGNEYGTIKKKYTQTIDDIQNFFSKKQ